MTTTETMLPITVEDLTSIPRARATRVSYNWAHYGRYTVWIAEVAHFGWSVVTDYGKPGVEAVVTAPRTRDNCIAALADYVRDYGRQGYGYDLTVEEWETVSVKLDAWITHTYALGLKWAPLPN
ncbi:hypothetical protein [Streptomyces sp. NPDC058272]|uniref:hypothetical protein n=1 Tax=Streptomyces sp. NPDC058272 TaxID=3346415 RepID=UPI0036E0013F